MGLLLGGILACAGCGKSNQNAVTSGPQMDLAKFTQAFPSPTPEQQTGIANISNDIRYRLYPKALEGLDALAADTSLTEQQKKAVADMIAGIQHAMTNEPAAAPQ